MHKKTRLVLVILFVLFDLMIIVSLLLFKQFTLEDLLPMTLILGIVGALLFINRKNKNSTLVKADERVKKIDSKAFVNSWIATLFTATLISWIDQMGFAKLSVGQVCFIILVAMLCSYWIFHFALLRKADID